jgi:prepilin peptidase CpaA
MALFLIVLVAGTALAAFFDLRVRRIPNALIAPLAIAAVALHAAGGVVAALVVLAAMAVAFALGSIAFSAGWLGGGDVKLIAVACGLASVPGCFALVGFILIAGGVLALADAIAQRRLVALVRGASLLATTGAAPGIASLPYGVAVAAGSAAYALSTVVHVLRLPA